MTKDTPELHVAEKKLGENVLIIIPRWKKRTQCRTRQLILLPKLVWYIYVPV